MNFLGVRLPSRHASAIDNDTAKPALHVGVQDWPCKALVLLRVAALATALIMQFCWHMNFVGVWLPSLHASAVDVEIEKPTLHVVGVQDWPCKTLVLLHVAALNTALVMSNPDGK